MCRNRLGLSIGLRSELWIYVLCLIENVSFCFGKYCYRYEHERCAISVQCANNAVSSEPPSLLNLARSYFRRAHQSNTTMLKQNLGTSALTQCLFSERTATSYDCIVKKVVKALTCFRLVIANATMPSADVRVFFRARISLASGRLETERIATYCMLNSDLTMTKAMLGNLVH